jgi:hypothetical protein
VLSAVHIFHYKELSLQVIDWFYWLYISDTWFSIFSFMISLWLHLSFLQLVFTLYNSFVFSLSYLAFNATKFFFIPWPLVCFKTWLFTYNFPDNFGCVIPFKLFEGGFPGDRKYTLLFHLSQSVFCIISTFLEFQWVTLLFNSLRSHL